MSMGCCVVMVGGGKTHPAKEEVKAQKTRTAPLCSAQTF